MKSYIFFIILLFSTLLSFGQRTNHLSFKGVPVDGKLTDYVTKMSSEGFRYVGTKDGAAMLNGDFAGYKNCLVGVSTVKEMDLVSHINVFFPPHRQWGTLSSNYFNIKEMLTEKYGMPSKTEERFFWSREPQTDSEKMLAIKMNQYKYSTVYKTDQGAIELSILGGFYSSRVRLTYLDKVNSEIIRKLAMEDL